jgi:hypothetical protein
MKRVKIELNIDPEVLTATRQFMDEKGLKIDAELSDSVAKLYKKYVPADVRKYIEGRVPTVSSLRTKGRAEGVSEPHIRGSETPNLNSEFGDFHQGSSE